MTTPATPIGTVKILKTNKFAVDYFHYKKDEEINKQYQLDTKQPDKTKTKIAWHLFLPNGKRLERLDEEGEDFAGYPEDLFLWLQKMGMTKTPAQEQENGDTP